jgi:hypothetical protein
METAEASLLGVEEWTKFPIIRVKSLDFAVLGHFFQGFGHCWVFYPLNGRNHSLRIIPRKQN